MTFSNKMWPNFGCYETELEVEDLRRLNNFWRISKIIQLGMVGLEFDICSYLNYFRIFCNILKKNLHFVYLYLCIFSCDEQFKKWRCHSVCKLVCMFVLKQYFCMKEVRALPIVATINCIYFLHLSHLYFLWLFE